MNLTAFFMLPSPVSACSCEMADQAALDGAPAAAIGTVMGRNDALWVVRISEDVKGNLPDEVAIEAYENNGDNCGVAWAPGRAISTLLYPNDDGHLRANECGEMSPDDLRTWTPPSTQAGARPDLVVGGSWDAYRTVGFADGEPIAFGFESGSVLAIATCPDETALAELVAVDDRHEVAVRSLSDFSVVWSRAATLPEADSEPEIACIDEETVAYRTAGTTQTVVRDSPDANEAADIANGDAAAGAWSGRSTPSRVPETHAVRALSEVALTTAPALSGDLASAPAPSPLELLEPPPPGAWSPWLLVLLGAVFVLYLAKNARNPRWRSAWSRPDNRRDDGRIRPDARPSEGWFDRFR